MNQYDLKGRRAVVTGAAQGFGRAITERFLDSGASVALWDMDADESAKAARELESRGRVLTQAVDVSDLAQVEAAAAATAAAFGGIDILVANAGIAGSNHKTWEYPVGRVAAGHRDRPDGRVLLLPCRHPAHAASSATDAS